MTDLSNNLFDKYSNYCFSYIRKEFAQHDKKKSYILILEAISYVVENNIVTKKMSAVEIKKGLRKQINILYKKYNSQQGFMFHIDLLEKHKSEMEARIEKKLKSKSNYKELFEENIHKSIDLQKKLNHIPFMYYVRAWQQMPLYYNNSKIKSNYNKLIKCHDLILLHKIFGINQKTIIKGLNFAYPLKTVGSLKSQLSLCMGMLIDLARILYNNDLVKNEK